MSVFDIMRRRRSISKMIEERPTVTQVEQVLEAATYAPNHHKVEPWKFIVLAGKAREELGIIMALSLFTKLSETSDEDIKSRLRKERNKPLLSPVVIVVVAERSCRPKVLEIENIEAVAAAVENMLLASEELGLACMWRTGEAAYDWRVKEWLGLAPEDHIVSFLYLGYPAISSPKRIPTNFKEKTTWLGWNE